MKPPVRAIVGNLLWSADGGVWALWRVGSLPYAHGTGPRRQAVHKRLRGLLAAMPDESMLLSVCARVDPWDVAADMADGVDLARHDAWAQVCEATVEWADDVALYRRRDYLGVLLTPTRAPWRDLLRTAVDDVTAAFGLSPRPVPAAEAEALAEQAEIVQGRLGTHLTLRPAEAGEVCWLLARALRREASEPGYDRTWEPGQEVRARPLDVVVVEGDDPGLRHPGSPDGAADGLGGRYVRVDTPDGTAYQTVLAVADLPQHVRGSDSARPWLFDVDAVGFPVDWCIRREGGDAVVLYTLAAPSRAELEERAEALMSGYEPREYGLARPVTEQLALLRSTLPGTAPAPACARYRQSLAVDDLTAAAPFASAAVGEPHGLLLGLSLDGGTATPVHVHPGSLVAVGAPGSGVSYLLKRLVWDTVARGSQVVVVDRSPDGEYVRFARAVPGVIQVVPVDPTGAVTSVADVVGDPGAEPADLVVLWAPGDGGDDAAAALLGVAVDLLAVDAGRDGAVVLDDAGPVLAQPEGRAAIAEALRRGPRHHTGLWLGCGTPELLAPGDVLDAIGHRFVLDQLDEDIPAALAVLGYEPDDPSGHEVAGLLDAGLAIGQCLLRDSRGRLGHVQVLPPLLDALQPAFEPYALMGDGAGDDELPEADEVDEVDDMVEVQEVSPA